MGLKMESILFELLWLLVALCAVAGLCLWLPGRAFGKKTKIQEVWEQEQKVRDMARCAAIEEGLKDWLTTLRLPALEEQTRLEAAARQLRIVLVEKLMRGPLVR